MPNHKKYFSDEERKMGLKQSKEKYRLSPKGKTTYAKYKAQGQPNCDYKRLYGISKKERYTMAVNQNHQCAICKRVLPLVVDHDHNTGKIRALLCRSCNRGIGYLGDNAIRIQAAAEYLVCHAGL